MLLSVIFTLLTMLLAEVGAFIAASADCLRRDVFAQYGSRFLLAKDGDLTDTSPLSLRPKHRDLFQQLLQEFLII
uniref:Secreted protein n=1 Tax=Steinernema glaseri TaxID=37863 RepID=A0A1I7YTI5_9BILA